jgi:hypothetical protein
MKAKITAIMKNNELYKLTWACIPEKVFNGIVEQAEKWEQEDPESPITEDDMYTLLIDTIYDHIRDEYKDEHPGAEYEEYDPVISKMFRLMNEGKQYDEAGDMAGLWG